MSKKILSLALVVVMLFSVLSISTSAAPAEGGVGLKMVTDAKVGMPAGTVITAKFYYTFPEGTDYSTYTHSLGNLCVGFTDGYQVNSANVGTGSCGKDALTIGASYTGVFKSDFTVNDLPAQWTNISAKFNENDTAKGWDDCILVVPTYLSGGAYNAKTGYPIDPDCELFSISFITTRTLTAEDSIGFVEGTIGGLTKVQYYDTTNAKSVQYTAAQIDMTEAVSYAAAAVPEVTFEKAQSKWAGGVAGEDYLFGFVGKIANFTPVTGATNSKGNLEVTNISKISVTVTINGKPVTAKTETIWKGADGSYYFRAQVANFEYTDTTVVENVVFSVETTDGTYSSSNYVANSLTVNGIYTTSVSSGLTAA